MSRGVLSGLIGIISRNAIVFGLRRSDVRQTWHGVARFNPDACASRLLSFGCLGHPIMLAVGREPSGQNCGEHCKVSYTSTRILVRNAGSSTHLGYSYSNTPIAKPLGVPHVLLHFAMSLCVAVALRKALSNSPHSCIAFESLDSAQCR